MRRRILYHKKQEPNHELLITSFSYGNISNSGSSELPILTVTYDGEKITNYTMSFVIANSKVDGFTVDSGTGRVSYDKSNTGEMPIDLGTILVTVTYNGLTAIGTADVYQDEADKYKIGYHLEGSWHYPDIVTTYSGDSFSIVMLPDVSLEFYLIENDRTKNTIATYTSATQALNAGVSLSFSITNTIDSFSYTIDGVEYKPLALAPESGSVAIDTKNNGNITVNITDPDKVGIYELGDTTIKGSMSGYVLESAFIEKQALLINAY